MKPGNAWRLPQSLRSPNYVVPNGSRCGVRNPPACGQAGASRVPEPRLFGPCTDARMRKVAVGPHLSAISTYAPWAIDWLAQAADPTLILNPQRLHAHHNEYRKSRGLILPGDFLASAPPAMVTDDTEPYEYIATNRPTGTLLTDWCRPSWPFPGAPIALADHRLRRIADLCNLASGLIASIRDHGDDPVAGRLPGGLDPATAILGIQHKYRMSNGETWTNLYRRTDTTTDPIAMTAYGALGIVGGTLVELVNKELADGPVPGPVLATLAACEQHPWYWSDAVKAMLPGVNAELVQRQIAKSIAERKRAQAAPTHGEADAGYPPPGPALTVNDSRVLQSMAMFDASRLLSANAIRTEMVKRERLSARTIGPIVRRLIALGLAERPEGGRSGARLTIAGRRLASKIAD